MSVTIHWRPHGEKAKHFNGGTSTSLDKLKRVFGSVIKTENVPELLAMAKVTDDPFYNEVMEIVEKIGAIEIWGEY